MEGSAIAVLVVAGVLGLAAIILAFVAEGTSIKVNDVAYSLSDEICYYPATSAKALGIVAAILLLIHHILISVGARCFANFCCSGAISAQARPSPQARPSCCPDVCSLISFIFSWVVFVGAFISLINAAVVNNMYYLVNHGTSDNPCPVPKPGLFAGAAVLCLVSVALSFTSYILFICSDRQTVANQSTNNGVAMGQPRFPKEQV